MRYRDQGFDWLVWALFLGLPPLVMHQAATSLTFEDSVERARRVTLEPGAAYRVRLDLRCEARAFFALGATECTFGTNDVEDAGPFARIRDISVTYQP